MKNLRKNSKILEKKNNEKALLLIPKSLEMSGCSPLATFWSVPSIERTSSWLSSSFFSCELKNAFITFLSSIQVILDEGGNDDYFVFTKFLMRCSRISQLWNGFPNLLEMHKINWPNCLAHLGRDFADRAAAGRVEVEVRIGLSQDGRHQGQAIPAAT